MRGNGAMAGIAHGDVGCGGLWRDVGEEYGTKMGGKMGENWGGNGTKYPLFTGPFLPFTRRSAPPFPLQKPAHRIHRRNNGNSCHSPTPTATAAHADALLHAPAGVDARKYRRAHLISLQGPPPPSPEVGLPLSHARHCPPAEARLMRLEPAPAVVRGGGGIPGASPGTYQKRGGGGGGLGAKSLFAKKGPTRFSP